MDLFTVTLAHNDTLLSVPVSKIEGLGETKEDQVGYIVAGGKVIRVNEDYGTLVDMWRNLTGVE